MSNISHHIIEKSKYKFTLQIEKNFPFNQTHLTIETKTMIVELMYDNLLDIDINSYISLKTQKNYILRLDSYGLNCITADANILEFNMSRDDSLPTSIVKVKLPKYATLAIIDYIIEQAKQWQNNL